MSNLPDSSSRRRLLIVCLCIVALGFGMVVYNLYKVQITQGDFYQQRAIAQQLRTTPITANRGTIYDRNGNTLAVSATVWTVLFSPHDIDDAEAEILADGMSEILGVDREFVIEKAKNKKNYYQIVKKKVEKETADKVIAFAAEHKIAGVSLQKDSKRYYPYGSLGSSVLGFVNEENQGAYGIESYYNTTLSGTPGKVVAAKNAWGTDMPFSYQEMYDAKDGHSLVLTLDETIQHMLDKHLETAVVEHKVRNRAAGIIMNVKSGEILGMTTKPDFDPNEAYEIADPAAKAAVEALRGDDEAYQQALNAARFAQWNNKCISEPYEPGSVFKIVTLSTGLETGAVVPSNHFHCPGFYMVGNVRKGCWKTAGHGDQDLAAAVRNSCNPAFMMVGQRIGAERFYDYFSNFGFTETTGVDLPGEAIGSYHSKKALTNPNDYENSLTSCSFGQTFKVTPLQLITAVAAAVNGGTLYEPHVVKQILDAEGNIVQSIEPNAKRQVISAETSAIVCQMLETVVTEGSGKNSYIPGYRIGGKTGTSEKIDLMNKTGEDRKVLSFVGIAPMDDPQIACLVLLDEPTLVNEYGSTIAAPVVGSILADVLPYLGMEKVYTEEELKKLDVYVENQVAKVAHDAQSACTRTGLNARIIGGGGTVVSQIPAAGSTVPKGSTIMLYTDESAESDVVTVPDVIGKSGLVVNRLVLNAGLNIKITGVGIENENAVAAKQTPAGGTEVPRGTVVTIDFADTTLHDSF
ncbi:MAG: PASTA domain-containing protein [Angelakisella sp.]|nr:PASTA domain-containing protein [Angelakisella sp.]MCI9528119.1 PASTA domain-containing protein [Angelakisella sp.]